WRCLARKVRWRTGKIVQMRRVVILAICPPAALAAARRHAYPVFRSRTERSSAHSRSSTQPRDRSEITNPDREQPRPGPGSAVADVRVANLWRSGADET